MHYIAHGELNCPRGTLTVITNAVGLMATGQGEAGDRKPVWLANPFHENAAVAVAQNAVIVAGTDRQFADPEAEPEETYGIAALDIQSGQPLWKHALPAPPVAWLPWKF